MARPLGQCLVIVHVGRSMVEALSQHPVWERGVLFVSILKGGNWDPERVSGSLMITGGGGAGTGKAVFLQDTPPRLQPCSPLVMDTHPLGSFLSSAPFPTSLGPSPILPRVG